MKKQLDQPNPIQQAIEAALNSIGNQVEGKGGKEEPASASS
jgi:hypothetical protein